MGDKFNENVFLGRFRLTDKTLNDIAKNVEDEYGVEVKKIEENDEGYVLIGKYGFTIGDITYDYTKGTYRNFNFHRGVIESINNREKARVRRREYKLQKNKRRGIALTAAGVVVLIALGVIKTKNDRIVSDTPTSSVVSYEQQHLNTINTANDLILVGWANYAMGQVSDICSNSEYEMVQSMRDDVYTNIYAPVMTNYYSYLDIVDSDMPIDIVGDSMESKHETFRNSAFEFDEYLKNTTFGSASFSESPFVDAIVIDKDGNVIGDSTRYYGETYDINGNLITFDDNEVKVYIKATDVPNSNYSMDNLPSDTKFYNGVAYVSIEHLYEFNTKTK